MGHINLWWSNSHYNWDYNRQISILWMIYLWYWLSTLSSLIKYFHFFNQSFAWKLHFCHLQQRMASSASGLGRNVFYGLFSHGLLYDVIEDLKMLQKCQETTAFSLITLESENGPRPIWPITTTGIKLYILWKFGQNRSRGNGAHRPPDRHSFSSDLNSNNGRNDRIRLF